MAKILLVDDAAFMRMMLKNTLTQAGYTDLYEAEDGLKAEEVYQAEKPGSCIYGYYNAESGRFGDIEEDQSGRPGCNDRNVFCNGTGEHGYGIH